MVHISNIVLTLNFIFFKKSNLSSLEGRGLRIKRSHLHCHGEVVLRLWREKYVDCFLLEGGVPCRGRTHLDDVKLATLSAPHTEAKQC